MCNQQMVKLKRAFSLLLVLTLVVVMTACSSSETVTPAASAVPTVSASAESEEPTESVTPAELPEEDSAEEPAESASSEMIELTFWTYEDTTGDIQKATDDFMAENQNIKVSVVQNNPDVNQQNLRVAASSSTLPQMWRNWGGSLGFYYPLNGLTYDLRDYAESNGWNELYMESALNLATAPDGQLAGIPVALNALGIYHRKDVFENNGLIPPTNFAELETLLVQAKESGIIPITSGGKFGWHPMRLLQGMLEMFCGSETHDQLLSLDASWDQEGVVKTFAKYKEWVDNGYFPEGFLTSDPNADARFMLFSGMAGIEMEGTWFNNQIKNEGQNLDEYAYFPFPGETGGARVSAFVDLAQFNKTLSEAELDASVKYIQYMYSIDAGTKYAYVTFPQPLVGAPLPEDQVFVKGILDDMEKNGSYTIADQGLPTEICNKLFEVQDNLALGQMTPEEGAAFMQAEIEKYKAENVE